MDFAIMEIAFVDQVSLEMIAQRKMKLKILLNVQLIALMNV